MRRRTIGLSCAVLSLACSADQPSAPVHQNSTDSTSTVSLALEGLSIATYDKSGETVHPDFALAPSWWRQGSRYLAVTPYPNGDARKENPSLFVGTDPYHWEVPAGAQNPLRIPSSGHLSDPDIVFNPVTRELWMYYRRVDDMNRIRLIRSADAVSWSEPVTIVEGANHTVVSPSVVSMPDGSWLMWAVNAGDLGCGDNYTTVELRRSSDGMNWSGPEEVSLPTPPSGLRPWHIEVQWIPSRDEFWAVFNGKEPDNCGTTALYLATSRDGVDWTTHPRPLLLAGEIPDLATVVYRSTFKYDPTVDQVTFWYSGARSVKGRQIWSTVVRKTRRVDMMARIDDVLGMRSKLVPRGRRLIRPP